MFFKKTICLIALITAAFCKQVPSSESKNYVLKNLKQLKELVKKKESAKPGLQLGILFDEYAEDASKLLEEWDKQNTGESSREEMVTQIAHHMTVLQKLLMIMNNSTSDSEPLEIFCFSQKNDELWGDICGDRPTKRVLRKDIFLKTEDGTRNSEKINCPNFLPIVTKSADDTELQIKLEQK